MGSHVLLVCGVACCTLGHGLQLAGVQHAYWGSCRVLYDLAALPGFDAGHVTALVVKGSDGHTVALTSATASHAVTPAFQAPSLAITADADAETTT